MATTLQRQFVLIGLDGIGQSVFHTLPTDWHTLSTKWRTLTIFFTLL